MQEITRQKKKNKSEKYQQKKIERKKRGYTCSLAKNVILKDRESIKKCVLNHKNCSLLLNENKEVKGKKTI